MIELTKEYLNKYIKICEKEGRVYDSEDKYREEAQNLLNFAELVYDMAKEELIRKNRLKKEPKGFEMEDEGRTCSLCGRAAYGELKMWYDKWGMKCMDCQNALNKKIIPGYVFKDRDNNRHVTASTLSWKLEVRDSTIKKLVRQGKLKPRIIPGSETMVFLATENPDIVAVIEHEKSAKRKP